MLAVTLLIATMIPAENVVRDTVDVIELNHFYDKENLKHIFDQYIYWDFDTSRWFGGQHHVVDWRLATGKKNMLPRRAVGGGFVQTFWDKDQLREVRSISLRETWTTYDPELAERARFPKEERRGLR